MNNETPLASCRAIAFIPTRDPARAKAFYRDTLGLTLVDEQLPFALVFDVAGVMLRVTVVHELTPHPFTAFGWDVREIHSVAKALAAAGITFERYAGLDQDEDGVWTTPGAQVAWFKDPDGNVLSISEH